MTRSTKNPEGPVTRLSVSVSPEIAAKLDAYCEKKERPRSWVIEKLIARYLEKMP